jgi:hypothetical protein
MRGSLFNGRALYSNYVSPLPLASMSATLALDSLPGDVLVIVVLCMDAKSSLALSEVSLLCVISLGTPILAFHRHAACFTT